MLVDAAWDLLLGARCAGCGVGGRPWCRACAAGLAAAVADSPRRAVVVPEPPGLPPVWSAGPYAGDLRAAVLAYKERGRRRLADPLGAALTGALVVAAPPATAVLVGIPASAASRRERGYDHVALLLRAVAARGGPPAASLLTWSRTTGDQAAMTATRRRANRAGALVARPYAGPVVLVDDVVTTGATLAEAARALRAAGADVVAAVTVATTVRGRGPRGVRQGDGVCPGGVRRR